MAEPPIALSEVQGYAYGAGRAARVAALLGQDSAAAEYHRRASAMQEAFEDAFWLEDLGTYALALDGHKQPCRVRASNAGHCLFTGIVRPDRAPRVAASLLDEDGFSGWGSARSPLGRHVTARCRGTTGRSGRTTTLIAAGLARYGLTDALMRLFTGIFDMSLAVDLRRLPELVCGFHRRAGEAPTLYPVACAPQAWAAGAAHLLVASALGLSVSAAERRILCAARPASLAALGPARTAHRGGDAAVDLLLERHENDVGVRVLRRSGDVEIVTVK